MKKRKKQKPRPKQVFYEWKAYGWCASCGFGACEHLNAKILDALEEK